MLPPEGVFLISDFNFYDSGRTGRWDRRRFMMTMSLWYSEQSAARMSGGQGSPV